VKLAAPPTLSETELEDALIAAVGKYSDLHLTHGMTDGVAAVQAAFYVETATGVPLGTPADRERVTAALGRLVERGKLTYLDSIKGLTVVDAETGKAQRVSSPMRRWLPA
jgi:hypothetical protein